MKPRLVSEGTFNTGNVSSPARHPAELCVMKRFFQKIFYWENWSYDLIYAPLGPVWLYYAIRARAFWFFTPVNPSLVFAGFEGGSKKEMYDHLATDLYPTTLLIDNAMAFDNVTALMRNAGLQFPVVVKPDTGMQGVLFRIYNNEEKLAAYHRLVGEKYILQTFVQLPLEFSVFHIIYPGAAKGKITGFILKDYLHVTGDGYSTLGQLIADHPTAKYKTEKLRRKHSDRWNDIIPAGEKYILNFAGNHTHGAKFINLHHEIDEKLLSVFDRISKDARQFYFGRYDLKCTSVEDLKNGRDIQILEYNGAGAATTHIFDSGMSYWQALKVIVQHWEDLYRIGKINHRKGVPYWGFWKGRRFLQNAKKNYNRMKALEQSIP